MFFKMDNQQQDNINNLKFKKVKDFPLYSVSNTGIVRNDKTNKNLSPRFYEDIKEWLYIKMALPMIRGYIDW